MLVKDDAVHKSCQLWRFADSSTACLVKLAFCKSSQTHLSVWLAVCLFVCLISCLSVCLSSCQPNHTYWCQPFLLIPFMSSSVMMWLQWYACSRYKAGPTAFELQGNLNSKALTASEQLLAEEQQAAARAAAKKAKKQKQKAKKQDSKAQQAPAQPQAVHTGMLATASGLCPFSVITTTVCMETQAKLRKSSKRLSAAA